MHVTRSLAGAAIVLGCMGVVTAPGARARGEAPRIVTAVMQDADGDARADSVRLTYSMRVRHARDRDGRYPFTVAGHRIRSVEASSRKALVLVLEERAQPDTSARPAIRYRSTRSRPVLSLAGRQAAAQLFRATRAHGHRPPVVATPPPPTTPSAPPTPLDSDGDGALDAQDCAPRNRDVHPGAGDRPDLAFVDSNCDGIDGTEKDAIFVSPKGKDIDPGTKGKPMRQIQAAVLEASRQGKDVYAAVGEYGQISDAETGVAVYGGYDAASWSRRGGEPSTVTSGSGQGVLVDDERNVLLQLLTVRGTSGSQTTYGIRVINGSSVTLQRVEVSAAAGGPGGRGAPGASGQPGAAGENGHTGHCDSNQTVSSRWGGSGGAGGASAIGRAGGDGGQGGDVEGVGAEAGTRGKLGEVLGVDGGTAGSGGGSGNPGGDGKPGGPGGAGEHGRPGSGGGSTTALASTEWRGQAGSSGTAGTPGGGGGGGGAQTGLFVLEGPGNGGGGGGAGGAGGRPGSGGIAGGGSFGIYLFNSTIVIESSKVTAGNGGAGGDGGSAGRGGPGGVRGLGATACTSEVGAGGNGGPGGDGGWGGAGGGGAGGPSIGIFKLGTSKLTLADTKLAFGTGGSPGGPGGGGDGGATAAPAQAGIAQAVYP